MSPSEWKRSTSLPSFLVPSPCSGALPDCGQVAWALEVTATSARLWRKAGARIAFARPQPETALKQ